MAEYRYHRISTKFWTDEKVLRWDGDTRLLALYLLTSPHRTTEGLFRLPKPYIAADLGWTPERLAKPFAQLLAEGFLEYDETVSVMLLCKALRYQAPENPNQAIAAARIVAGLPRTPLFARFYALAEEICPRLAEALKDVCGERLCDAPQLTPAKQTSSERLREPLAEPLAEPLGEPLPQPLGEPLGEPIPQPPSPSPSPSLTQERTIIVPNGPTASEPKHDEDSTPYQLAVHLRVAILARDSSTKVPDETPAALERWSVEADRMLRLDGRDASEAAELMTWCQQDSFWSGNVLSMAAFRKQYDRLKRQAQQGTRADPRQGRVQGETAVDRMLREGGMQL